MSARPRLPERLEGSRLVLQRWTPYDVETLNPAVERNMDHLRPWMPWVASELLSIEERLALLRRWDHEWREGGDVAMAILLEGEVVGSTGLHRRRGPHGLEIGYWVDKDHLRQGIASEAVEMLTTAALAQPDVTFLEIHHDKANFRSRGVPVRLGYEFIAELPDAIEAPGEVGIDCAWRMTVGRWRSRDRAT